MTKPAPEVRVDRRVMVALHGATITPDAGLLAARELDEALGLTEMATSHLEEGRTGRNVQHQLAPSLRQAVCRRLAGYANTIRLRRAERLAPDPAMPGMAGWWGP